MFKNGTLRLVGYFARVRLVGLTVFKPSAIFNSGFLRRLNNLGISEIQDLPDFKNLIELTSPEH